MLPWLSNVSRQDKASQRTAWRKRQPRFLRSWTLSCLSASQVILEKHLFSTERSDMWKYITYIIWTATHQKFVLYLCVCVFNVLLRQDQESYQQDHQEVCFSEFWAEWFLCCLSQRGPFQSGPAAGYVGSGGGRLGRAESCHRADFSTESKAAQKTGPHWLLCRLGLHSRTFSSRCQTGSVIGSESMN